MLRIVHSADWHFSERQYGIRTRELDYYSAGDFIANRACELNADALILAGDILDIVKPTSEAIFRLKQIVQRLKDCGIPVFGIDGNHDAADGQWLRVCDITPLTTTPCVITNKAGTDAVTIAGINSCRPQVFHTRLNELVKKDERIDILVIHQPLEEMCYFTGVDLTATDIASKVRDIGIRYVAMGDIHDRKEAQFNGVWFVYPGSPEVTAINEKTDKTFSIIDISATALSLGVEPIPIRERIEITLNKQEDLDNLKVALNKTPDAFFNIWYTPDNSELSKRAAVLLTSTPHMYRILPLFKPQDGQQNNQTLVKHSYERGGAINRLHSAIHTYFEPESDEAQLVAQLLSAPPNTLQILNNYLETKGLKQ